MNIHYHRTQMCSDCSLTRGHHPASRNFQTKSQTKFKNVKRSTVKHSYTFCKIKAVQNSVYRVDLPNEEKDLQLKRMKTLNQRMSGMGLPSTTTAKRGVSPAQTSKSSMIVSNVGGAVDIVERYEKRYIKFRWNRHS